MLDTVGHMAEETSNPQINAPRGIILTNLATGLSGLLLIISLLFVTTDIEAAIAGDSVNFGDTGYAAINTFVSRLPIPWARILTWLIVINLFLAGVASVGVTGRITFALMRDNALPYGQFFSRVHPTLRSPINALFFVCFIACLILLLPLDDNGTIAFYSIIGISTVGFQVSYAIPIFLKAYYQPSYFPITPFNLGKFSFPMAVISTSWLLGTCCIFFLPTSYPVDSTNMNWVVVVVTGAMFLCGLNWVLNSRFHFRGPKRYRHTESDALLVVAMKT